MRRAIGNSGRGNMRNGLISLLTVVVVISMATAAVLAISTSHAMGALAQRQATMTADGYALEQSGQALLANLDELLHQSRGSAVGGTAGGAAGGAVIAQVENRMNSMLVDSCAKGVTATYETEDDGLTCTFISEHGRMLTVTISVGGNATYDVRAWQLTAAPQEENTGDTLWTGSTAGE